MTPISPVPPQLPPLMIDGEEVVPSEATIIEMDSKIVLSFAMANGGDPFVRWLRQELITFYALPTQTSVYVDHILAPDLALSQMWMVKRKPKGDQRVENPMTGIAGNMPTLATRRSAPDTRPGMQLPDGRTPTGHLRDDWKILFRSALRVANVAIVCLNHEFYRSEWCQQEMVMMAVENELRRQAGRSLLRVIIVRLQDPDKPDDKFRRDANLLIGSAAPNAELLHLDKIKVGRDDALASHVFWKISPEGFRLLTSTIGQLV